MLFGNEDNEINEDEMALENRGDDEDLEVNNEDPDGNTEDLNGEEENEKEIIYLTKDPIRKHQFDHNRNTCMTNNYPEIFVDENGRRGPNTEELSFAPAEGNYPTNILNEKDWDIKSWPALHPDGKYGMNYTRNVRLTDQQYIGQRILNKDQRFSKSPGYIFASAAFIEQKQLSNKANISYMRGKKSLNKDGLAQFDLNDAFTVLDGIKNTPKYWQTVKYDMIAKLENLGPFHLFFTLSCGDTRCDENFSSFLAENNFSLEYFVNADGTTETKVQSKDGELKSLKQFLQEDIDDYEMIRTNVLTATRNFQKY